jgi:hypothetical protein
MAALLSVFTKEVQHSVIQVLWSESVSGATIYQKFPTQYGNNVLPQMSVCECIEKLKNGWLW